jgi:exodeoxyribonuclease-3
MVPALVTARPEATPVANVRAIVSENVHPVLAVQAPCVTLTVDPPVEKMKALTLLNRIGTELIAGIVEEQRTIASAERKSVTIVEQPEMKTETEKETATVSDDDVVILSTTYCEAGKEKSKPKTVHDALKCLKRKKQSKLKPAMKILKEEDVSEENAQLLIAYLEVWLADEKSDLCFLAVAKALVNWIETNAEDLKTGTLKKVIARTTARILELKGALNDPDKQRTLKRLAVATMAAVTTKNFVNTWINLLSKKGTKVNDKHLVAWITEWSRKGETSCKQKWENFGKHYVESSKTWTESTIQSCEITLRQKDEKLARKDLETFVLWNGNGARARWAGTSELKEVVQGTDPDMLCFLEAKTDSDYLLKLEGFEQWALECGYTNIYCYWSRKGDRKAFGNEGIVIFTKVAPLKVQYGIGNKELDSQARVVTTEFADCIIIFTYNPQGGFAKESLQYRATWEAQLGDFMERKAAYAKRAKKRILWAGDLNVNPHENDCSPNAFDRIRHKIPKGEVPAGCRQQDREAYEELIAKMDGVNLAEHFNKQHIRTCFQDESFLRANAGQRLDHIIAQKELLDEKEMLRVAKYDTLHPLWCKLERGRKPTERKEAPVLIVAPEAGDERQRSSEKNQRA